MFQQIPTKQHHLALGIKVNSILRKYFFKSLLGCTTVLESLRIFCWLHGNCAKGATLMNFKTC